MDGRQVALGTLHQQAVPLPCINCCWMTNSRFMSHVAGRDYWADPEGVFIEFIRGCGINIVPQWYMPGEQHRRLEEGHLMYEGRPHEDQGFTSPEDVARSIEQLPDPDTVERDFDAEAAAAQYAATIKARMELLGPDVLVIDGFGQADFMGGYNRWGTRTTSPPPRSTRRRYAGSSGIPLPMLGCRTTP